MRAKAAQNEIHLHQGVPGSGTTLCTTGMAIGGHMGHHAHEAPHFPTNLPPPVEIYGKKDALYLLFISTDVKIHWRFSRICALTSDI